MDSFRKEVTLLKSGKSVSPTSRVLPLAPEYDQASGLIRVGGRRNRCDSLSLDVLCPILVSLSLNFQASNSAL